MKKYTSTLVITTLLLFAASSLQCDESEISKLPYVPQSDVTIHSKTFPLLWRTRVQDGEQITVRGSWMSEDKIIEPQSRTVFIESPVVDSVSQQTFTVTSQLTNCSKTYELTFTTPLSHSLTIPASVTLKQSWTTYGGSPIELTAMFQENGIVNVDISEMGCSAFSKSFPIRHFDQGHTWQTFLDEMKFYAAEAEGQSWNYQSFPAKCDASLNKIVLSDSFLQAAEPRMVQPHDSEPRLQSPSFSVTMMVDDYSCSGTRTAFADSIATLSANLGQVLCSSLNFTSSYCNIGYLNKPFSGCPPETGSIAPAQPRPVVVVTDQSTTEEDDKDNTKTAATIILIVVLCGVALLVLSVIGVWISKKVESFRRKNPPAAVEMFIQSEEGIFTVADDRSDNLDTI